MRLISKYKNEVVITDDKRKIERLKDLGFTEVKEQKTTNKKVGKDGNKEET